MTENGKLLLSVTEAARLLGISRNLAYSLISEGRLPSIRLGRRVLVARQALERWIERQIELPLADEPVVSLPHYQAKEDS